MRIGILGAGNMADALGTQWARAGHDVMIGARAPEKADVLARRVGGSVRAGRLRAAAGFGSVVLLAVPHAAVVEVVRHVDLQGRVLIDCTNAVGHGFTLTTDNAAEQLAALAPDASVVKAFNLCHESVWRLTPPDFADGPLAVPLCGDDAAALALVRGLVTDIGCLPVDGGPLARARHLEATAAFAIGLWAGGVDPRSAFPPYEIATGPTGA